MTARRAEIAANLERLETRIAAACAAAGRSRDEITLVAVTKTFPADDVMHLAALGVREVGENRDQDAAAKARACRDAGVPGLVWHFVGQLQRNKAASVASYADVVHSVDSERLLAALDRGAVRAGRTLEVLLQVSLDGDPGRGGVLAPDLAALARATVGCEALVLRGLMAVAPLGWDPRQAFDEVVALGAGLRRDHPTATWVSAGMSGDLEAAVAAGATHLRVGGAVLGSRPPLG